MNISNIGYCHHRIIDAVVDHRIHLDCHRVARQHLVTMATSSSFLIDFKYGTGLLYKVGKHQHVTNATDEPDDMYVCTNLLRWYVN